MSKFYFIVASFLLTATVATADPVSVEQARQKASAFAKKSGRNLSPSMKGKVHRAPSASGQTQSPYYIFDMDNDGGFVIVAGSDRARSILGYTEKGNYDEKTLPDNMKSFLRMYADAINSIESASKLNRTTKKRVQAVGGVPTAIGSAIQPLLRSQWNQGEPYWNQCPTHNGNRCYTGCTATAFAQVMYYHRYPTTATTSVPGYNDEDGGVTYSYGTLPSTTFNWNNMQDTYYGNTNGEEISKLMRYVGQGALMHYTPGGSGAAFVNAINALKNYFGYDQGIHEIWKDNGYSDSAWENAVYGELTAGRPVLIEGYSDQNYGGGHAFVCDGYRTDGCFHINWGWGGWCDGYFNLAILNPDDDSGMGAAKGSHGYYWHEGAVMGVQPPGGVGGGGYTTTDRGVATFYQDINYGGYAVSLPEGSFTLSQMQSYGIRNDDITSIRVSPGFKVTLYADNNFGGATKVITSDASYVGNDWNDQASSIRIEPNGVSGFSGIYKLQNRNSGQYLDLDGNSTADNAATVQWDDEGTELYQHWEFVEVQAGVYSIRALASGGKGLDCVNGSANGGTQVILYPYNGGAHQQFIVVDMGGGYYKLIARHCGKAVEVPNASTTHGEKIKIWENNDGTCQQWAIKRTTPSGPAMATFYKDANYAGSSAGLGEGSYTTAQMRIFGISDNDVSSLKVAPGFKVTVYVDDNFSGQSKTFTANTDYVGNDWNDKVSSFRIEPNGVSGFSGIYKLQNRNSGQYLDLDGNSTADNAATVQWDDEGTELYQHWEFVEVQAGVYSIRALASGNKGLNVANASANSGTQVNLYPYNGNKSQQFIVVDKGSGNYKLIARHCGKAVEVPNSSTTHGEKIKIWDNNEAACQQWAIKRTTPSGPAMATFYKDANYAGSNAGLGEGSYTTAQMRIFGINDNDITSLKVAPGFKVIAYVDDNFAGQSKTFTANTSNVGNDWNDKISSFKIEAQGVSGLDGRYKLQGHNSQLFWGIENASTANNAMLEQQDESNNNTQKFELREIAAGTGVYNIVNVNSDKYVKVKDGGTGNWADIIQTPLDANDKSMQWIAVDKGDGYYSFVVRHCGKIIEVPYDRRNAGEDIKIYDNNNQQCGWWKLVEADVIQTGPIGNYNVATFYQDINNGGYAVSLPEGNYTQEQLAAYGIRNNDISSFSVTPGFKVIIFDGSSFDGDTQTWTASSTWIGNQWNDRASSIRIEPNGATGLSGTWKLQNRNSGKYMDLDGNRTDNNTAIVQWDNEGAELYQQWRLNEVAPGVYTIQAAATSNRGLDVANISTDNWAQVLLYDYWNGFHQQFILFDKGGGYYQLVARHCGKPVELAYASTASGEWIRIYDNNGSDCQQWRLVNPANAYATAPASDATGIKTMHNEECIMHNAPAVYDLQGRKVADNPSSLISNPSFKPGIYIYNGKKIMLK